MLTPKTQHDHDGPSFFTALPVFVLLFEDDDGDPCLVTERTAQGRAVTCFLSPFDAVIEAVHGVTLGRFYHVVAASEVDWSVFRDADRLGFIADIHLGWPATDGNLLLRPSGRLGRYCRMMHHWARHPLTFEVDPVVLAEYSRIRERAGLFAWQETHREVLKWNTQRLYEVVERAFDSIERIQRDAADCKQIALFDPEFAQWHFVPVAESPNASPPGFPAGPRSRSGK